MKFVDEVELMLIAGKGGDGIVHFARTRRNPKGGPDGGDGGKGGDIILKASSRKLSLYDLKLSKVIKAEDGQRGGTNFKKGKSGKPVIIEVPLGTMVFDVDTQKLLVDLKTPDETFVVARGGKGGKGNAAFATARVQTPLKATKGLEGEKIKIKLALSFIAHVGLIGLPNAGKSSLLKALTNAKPKIADYPFSSLLPNLGVLELDETKLIIVDLPGIIKGASMGKGLGLQFLKHAERVGILALVADGRQLWNEIKNSKVDLPFEVLEKELNQYKEQLTKKPRIYIVSKVDLLQKKEVETIESFLKRKSLKPIFFVSSVSGAGLEDLKTYLINQLKYPLALI